MPTAPANLTAAPLLAPQAAPIPLAGVAIEIAGNALAGKNHFEIRLDPPELGRIEVRLDVDRDGNVTSRMIADRSDTLDLLRRDASGLERALQDAGLKTGNNSLQFSLRDQSTGQQQADGGANTTRLVVEDETPISIEPTSLDYGRLAGRSGGLDIRV
jgi:flagellar hook-length control protein FliK